MSRCCVGLCVKDSEEGLGRVFENVNKIRRCFQEFRVIVAYDKSEDASIQIISEYKRKHDDTVVLDVKNRETYDDAWQKHVDRSQRIANARNEILDHIGKHHDGWEYFIMMDTNNYSCVSPIDATVLSKILESDEWDGLSFNRDPYYDMWALSIPPLVLSCWHFHKAEKAGKVLNKYVVDRLAKLQSHEFLPVISAFNGFAIYRTDKFLNCRYTGKFNPGIFSQGSVRKHAELLDSKLVMRPNDCEHREFHVNAIKKNNARIMISPLQLFPLADSCDKK